MQETSAADGTPSAGVSNDAVPQSTVSQSTVRDAPVLDIQQRTAPALPQMDTLPPFPQARTPEPAPPKKRLKMPTWLLASALFLIGLLLGVAVMRQRAHSQTIVVSVNGDTITKEELFNQLQNVAGPQTVHKMVQNMLQMQFAQKKGLVPTDAEVDAEYAKMSARPNFLQAMAQSGVTEADFKRNLRLQLAETNVISQGVTVTEADAKNYYQAQSNPNNPNAQFYRPEEISLRAIATATQPQAQQAISELAAQTPFELVATTYSLDASKSNGGLLAPLALNRSPLHSNPALEKEIFGMSVGSQVGPVFFSGKWWIFRCQDKAPAATVPYAQVQEQCLTGAKLVKGTAANSKRIQQEFTDFQHSSNLQAFWKQYEKVVAAH